jgi:hypothetical protein
METKNAWQCLKTFWFYGKIIPKSGGYESDEEDRSP